MGVLGLAPWRRRGETLVFRALESRKQRSEVPRSVPSLASWWIPLKQESLSAAVRREPWCE